MPDVTVKVTGLEETARRLQRAEAELTRGTSLRKVFKDAAQPSYRTAKARTPVGGARDPHPGLLRRKTKLSVRSRGRSVGAFIRFETPYAGTRLFGREAKVKPHSRGGAAVAGYTRRLTPAPYPIRTIAEHQTQIRTDVETGVTQILDQVFGGGRG